MHEGPDVLLDSVGAVTNLVSEINTEVTGRDRDLKIRVSAPERGSFGIDSSLLSDAAELVMSAKEEIGVAASLVVTMTNLYQLHRWLGGEDPEEVEQDGGTTRVYRNNGDVTEFDTDVVHLYQESDDIRNELDETYEATKRDERVGGFRIEDPETGEEKFRADRSEFEALSDRGEADEETQTVTDQNETVTLTRVPLDDPERRWEILWDGKRVGVEVTDLGFHAQVQTRSISFQRGDRLEVDLEREQEFNETLNAWETTDHKITTVHSYISAGEQGDLFSEDDDD